MVARAGWDVIERDAIASGADPSLTLVQRPGVLYLDAPGSEVVARSQSSGAVFGVVCEPLDAREARAICLYTNTNGVTWLPIGFLARR